MSKIGDMLVMKKLVRLLALVPVFLAACVDTQIAANSAASSTFISTLPAGVLTIVAPYQDLTSVRIDPSDGCYVYRYVGPVETTFLPLRSVNGRPICTREAQTS